MSKLKALETLLVAATDYIYHTMRDQKNGLVNAIERDDVAAGDIKVGDLLRWRKDRRASLRGVETVNAKVTTKVVADNKQRQAVKESAVKHRVPAKSKLLNRQFHITARKRREITRVFDRAGVRWIELSDGKQIDTRDIVPVDGKVTSDNAWQYNTVQVKESKETRRKRNEEVHEVITKVANRAVNSALDDADAEMSSGAKSAREAKSAARNRRNGKDGVKAEASKLSQISDAIDPNKKSRVPFSEKVKVEIANRVDAGQITKKLMRQAHAYVDKHHLKVEHMQDLKVKPAADKVLKLTVKAAAKDA